MTDLLLPATARGEMAARFRQFDWSATPIGPPERWPQSWRNAVRIILDSSFPTALAIGHELIYFYNDAFIPLAGASRHPAALGQPVPIAWKEIWDQILLPRFTHTLTTGEPTGEADLLMPLERSGYLEETFITFSFAALRDDQNQPSGIFCTAIENTGRVIAQRQINCLRALAARSSFAETPEAACQCALATLESNPRDLPFALLYLLDKTGRRAQLAGTVGLATLPSTVPNLIELSGPDDAWRLATVNSSRDPVLVENVQQLIGNVVHTPDMTPKVAIALPIANPGSSSLAGVLVAGANPMRPLDESRAFHQLVAGHLETAISNARAKQHERERAHALAELDRAKTVFFNNISHELRTPLTLLMTPLDEVLGRAKLDEADRDLLQVARRGCGRLLKLVNSLLEFSRIEAGRLEATYQPTDLAAATADLASVFRSAFERAGVELTIDCPALPEPVFVDCDMWEKIVLNLVSNAFKFTLKGVVRVRQRALEEHVELEVSDTGCGVAAEDLPRLFERFFRGRAAESRTHEGSGIGLSLVQELVRLHGGTIEANSECGAGTTLTVRIPRGCGHLPQDRINPTRRLERARIGAGPYVEEALGWLPGDSAEVLASPGPVSVATQPADLLVVDDNADMRCYLARLLGERWHVETAPHGAAALASIRQRPPNLVIADVMMPGMDGFALLRQLRDDPQTREIPVMLLSARAGEEACTEGLRAGADDYVIKPFSARELTARVESRLTQARLHAAERLAREAAERANHARDEFFAMLSHELRTPLSAVLAWATLLRDKRLDARDTARAIDIIERNARLQRRLVDDLLDLSRIITGRLTLHLRTVPAPESLIAIVVDSFRPAAQARDITLQTSLAPGAGTLRADPERLQQVLWNLLSNAIRFTPPDGRIDVRCARVGAHIEISVCDTGQGIAPENLRNVFDRYWQERKEPGGEGLGIGLAVAHRIIELHGGTIEAMSDGEGRGATFKVRLPVSEALGREAGDAGQVSTELPAATIEAHAQRSPRMLDAALSSAELAMKLARRDIQSLDTMEASDGTAPEPVGLRILLVEDHDGIAKACQRLLASHGNTVVRAVGCAGALIAVEREPFDVVLCDLTLPDGSGLELLPRLRSQCERPLPAIAMSGRAYEDDIARCLAAGFTTHLTKPFDEGSLLAVLWEVAPRVNALPPQADAAAEAAVRRLNPRNPSQTP